MTTFPAGEYYITDLCYTSLGTDNLWDEFCDNDNQGEFTFKNGIRVWWHYTEYGDGIYQDQFGREYYVDSGLIGIVSVEDVKYKNGLGRIGQKVTFVHPFEVYYENENFHFGEITISTG